MTHTAKKLLFITTEDWFFCSHRLPLALAAQAQGYDIHVATKIQNHKQAIESHGFKLHKLNWHRHARSPFDYLIEIKELYSLIKKEQPDLIHFVSLKPIIFGILASLPFPKIKKIFAFTGLGTLFIQNTLKFAIARFFIKYLLRYTFKNHNHFAIIQNEDDLKFLTRKMHVIPHARTKLIKGSGVDISKFQESPLPEIKNNTLRFSYVGRMLKDKGIDILIKAHQILWTNNIKSELWLVGDIDLDNVSSYTKREMQEIARTPGVLWLGHRDDVNDIWSKSHVALLMSKREGLPKSLLEAASCGRPIIASDVPGCREVVINNLNGFLIPCGDYPALAEAMLCLIKGKADIFKMAKESRKLILEHMTQEVVCAQTLELYKEALQVSN